MEMSNENEDEVHKPLDLGHALRAYSLGWERGRER